MDSAALRAHAGVLTELETAAWKDARRFRVLAVDSGHLSFADYYLQTPSRPVSPSRAAFTPFQRHHNSTGFSITAEEQTAAVGDFFVLITQPPDARYSVHYVDPQSPVAVRALVVPAVAGADIVPENAEVSECAASGACKGSSPRLWPAFALHLGAQQRSTASSCLAAIPGCCLHASSSQ